MGHPSPSAAEWRQAIRELDVSRPAWQLAAWISTRPVADRPGAYRVGQRSAMQALRYSRRTIARAQAELVGRGLLTVTDRGMASRPQSIVELGLPTASNVPT